MPILEKQLPTFLVAEDSLLDFNLMEAAIHDTGIEYPIVHFETGAELIDYLQQSPHTYHDIAAIFLDLKMPVMNGLEALAIIKDDKLLKRIPVVMISASDYATDIETAYDLGVNGYVLKEMDITKFTDSIKHLVGFWGEYNQRPTTNSYK